MKEEVVEIRGEPSRVNCSACGYDLPVRRELSVDGRAVFIHDFNEFGTSRPSPDTPCVNEGKRFVYPKIALEELE